MQRTLARLLLIIACVLWQAYSSESGTNNHDAQHDAHARSPKITIISPADGSAVTSLPAMLEVKVGFGRGVGRRTTKALLNGVDITSQFSPGPHGVLAAQVDRPAVNLGKNQLRITSGDAVVSSTFVVSLSPAPEMPASEASLQAVDLLVGSGSTDKVLRYDGQTGDFIDAFVAARSGGLVIPSGLAIGPDGNLYVGDMSDSQVLRYDGLTGAFLNVFVVGGSGGLSVPTGLVFGPDGNLYVSSSAGEQVLRYHGQTGAFLGAFVTAFSGGLNSPQGLVFGPDGHLYVSSGLTNQVLRYDGQSGAFLGAFVTAGSGGLNDPLGPTATSTLSATTPTRYYAMTGRAAPSSTPS